MKTSFIAGALALSTLGMSVTAHADDYHHRHYRHYRSGHGNCLRFNKTTGSVAGAVGGGLLGNAIIGGTGGTLVGAAAGGIAGHELSHNRRKRC